MNICAIIVTYNRKSLLSHVLKRFEQLESPPDSLVIVDNHSTDGTPEIVHKWQTNTSYQNVFVIQLDKNLGGSGGFHKGLKAALTLNPDWIWLSDDDAFPDLNCFHILRSKLHHIDPLKYAAICCTVINKGNIDENHRRRLFKKFITLKEKNVPLGDYDLEEFDLDLFSYVGTVINARILRKAGLTDKDYFIWHDDFEHAWRLSRFGKIICLRDAKIYHDTTEDNQVTWKSYYGIRNKLLMFKHHHYVSYLKQLYLLHKKILFSSTLRKDPIYRKMVIAAVKDAMRNKKGLHSIYKPGWKKC